MYIYVYSTFSLNYILDENTDIYVKNPLLSVKIVYIYIYVHRKSTSNVYITTGISVPIVKK